MLRVPQDAVPGPTTFQIAAWAMASVKKCHRYVAETGLKSKSKAIIKDMLLLFSVQEARSFWVPINRKWQASKKEDSDSCCIIFLLLFLISCQCNQKIDLQELRFPSCFFPPLSKFQANNSVICKPCYSSLQQS